MIIILFLRAQTEYGWRFEVVHWSASSWFAVSFPVYSLRFSHLHGCPAPFVFTMSAPCYGYMYCHRNKVCICLFKSRPLPYDTLTVQRSRWFGRAYEVKPEIEAEQSKVCVTTWPAQVPHWSAVLSLWVQLHIRLVDYCLQCSMNSFNPT